MGNRVICVFSPIVILVVAALFSPSILLACEEARLLPEDENLISVVKNLQAREPKTVADEQELQLQLGILLEKLNQSEKDLVNQIKWEGIEKRKRLRQVLETKKKRSLIGLSKDILLKNS